MGWTSRPPINRTISFPIFLQLQAALDDFGMILGHLNGVGVTEEIRSVQQVDMQGVAFDPFAAIGEPAKRAQLASTFKPKASSIAWIALI